VILTISAFKALMSSYGVPLVIQIAILSNEGLSFKTKPATLFYFSNYSPIIAKSKSSQNLEVYCF